MLLSLNQPGIVGKVVEIPSTLLGGVIADRTDRRRIMILSQSISASMFFLLATLIVIEWVALWHVMSLAFLSGCVRAFD